MVIITKHWPQKKKKERPGTVTAVEGGGKRVGLAWARTPDQLQGSGAAEHGSLREEVEGGVF